MYLPHVRDNITFPYSLFNVCHQVQFQKILMDRFREKFESIDSGPKNVPFLPFFSQKRAPSLVCVY